MRLLGALLAIFLVTKIQAIQYAWSGSCTAPDTYTSCTLDCDGIDVDFSSVAVYDTSSYSEKTFTYYVSSLVYQFINPACGYSPTYTFAGTTWSSSDVWKFNTDGSNAVALGWYKRTGWSYGSDNGTFAVRNEGYSSTSCYDTASNSYTTITPSMYYVCNKQYSASSPNYYVTQTSSCTYDVVVEYDDICDSKKASTSSNYYGFLVLIPVFLIIGVIVFCYCRRYRWGVLRVQSALSDPQPIATYRLPDTNVYYASIVLPNVAVDQQTAYTSMNNNNPIVQAEANYSSVPSTAYVQVSDLSNV